MVANDYGQSPWQTMVESGYMQPPHDQTPAKIRKSKKKSVVLGNLIGGIIVLAGGANMWTGTTNSLDGYVETTGTIVSVDRNKSCKKGGSCSTVGTPTIAYVVDGEKITSQAYIRFGSEDESDVGKQLKVKYDPSDPSDVVVADAADTMGLIMKSAAGGFMGVGALCIVIGLVELLKKIIKLVTPL